MGKGMFWLLILGLTGFLHATELGLDNVTQEELKEIEAEIAKGNVPPGYTPSDKAKRGVAKLSNAESPSFNHLQQPNHLQQSSNIQQSSSSSSASNVKSTTSNGQAPYRLVYNNNNNNQFYQANPYVSYLQSPQAAQIASQYSFQPSGVAHYLQTPTQIQYVSTPTITTGRYQNINANSGINSVSAKVGTTNTASAAAVSSIGAAAATQYVSPAQQLYLSSPQQSSYQPQTAAISAQSIPTTTSTAQYQSPQQFYYPQQPIVMLLLQQQPQTASFLYPGQQQQQASYLLGQQQLYNLFGGHRFSIPYTPTPNNQQVTYLVPMAIQTTAQQPVGQTAAVKASEKQVQSIQTSQSGSSSYGIRTNKA